MSNQFSSRAGQQHTGTAVLEQETPAPLAGVGGADVDIQVTTAKRYPRSITLFVRRAQELATLNPDVAAACIYALPRDGKTVEGPSARFAEIMASCWGNIRSEGKTLGDDGQYVTSRGVSWDVESNNAIAFEVKRRITNRDGKTYNADMISVTGNAGASVALRNAILKVIPTAFWKPIYLACRKVVAGDAQTFAARRDVMLKEFAIMGVTTDRLCHAFGLKGVEDITLEHIATLRGFYTALKDGDTTIEECFPEHAAAGPMPTPRKAPMATAPPTAAAAAPAAETPPAADTAPVTTSAPDVIARSTVGAIASVDVRPNGAALITLSSGFICGTADAVLVEWAQGYRQSGVEVELIADPPKTPAHAPKLTEIREVVVREIGEEG